MNTFHILFSNKSNHQFYHDLTHTDILIIYGHILISFSRTYKGLREGDAFANSSVVDPM